MDLTKKKWLATANKPHISVFDRMVTELSPYMKQYEIEKCIGFQEKITTSQFDINPSVEDAKTQIKILIGSERYAECVEQWKKNNQNILTVFGTRKYRYIKDGTLWDGLDPTDKESDYEIVFV
jgi:hypothetical protein